MRRQLLTILMTGLMVGTLGGQPIGDEANLRPAVKALEARFVVEKGRYDRDKRQFNFQLEAKVTSEEPCLYDVVFQDADNKEVARVVLQFEDGGKRTEKGEKYRAAVKYPIRKTMEKVRAIVIQKAA